MLAALNFMTLILSRLIRQMLANFFEVDSKGLYQSSGKEKKVVVLCSRPRQNVKLGTFTLKSWNDGKEMYKKRDARAKLLYC